MGGLEHEVDVLRRIPLFGNVDPSRLKLLAFTSERVSFGAGQELFHEGDTGDAAYVIIEGSVDILKDTSEGEALVVTLKKNAFVGDIAILCDVPRTATVRAVDKIETLNIRAALRCTRTVYPLPRFTRQVSVAPTGNCMI